MPLQCEEACRVSGGESGKESGRFLGLQLGHLRHGFLAPPEGRNGSYLSSHWASSSPRKSLTPFFPLSHPIRPVTQPRPPAEAVCLPASGQRPPILVS